MVVVRCYYYGVIRFHNFLGASEFPISFRISLKVFEFPFSLNDKFGHQTVKFPMVELRLLRLSFCRAVEWMVIVAYYGLRIFAGQPPPVVCSQYLLQFDTIDWRDIL